MLSLQNVIKREKEIPRCMERVTLSLAIGSFSPQNQFFRLSSMTTTYRVSFQDYLLIC